MKIPPASWFMIILFVLIFIPFLQAQCPTTDHTLSNQSDINNFVNNCSSNATFAHNLTLNVGANTVDLSGMTFLEQVSGNLSITGNTNLSNLNGFQNLHTVTGNLFISGNTQFTNMEGLEGLQTVGGIFTIQSHDNLVNLNGLQDLMSVGSILRVWFNPALTNCATVGVCRLIETLPQSSFHFSDNAPSGACNNWFEVEADCEDIPDQVLCDSAEEIACGAILQGNRADLINTLNTVCGISTPFPDLVFKKTFTEDAVVDLYVDYEEEVNIYVLNACNPANCIHTGPGNEYSLSNIGAATYYFVIDFPAANNDEYAVLFSCDNMPGGNCTDAIPVNCGEVYVGNSAGAFNSWRGTVNCQNGGVSSATLLRKDVTHAVHLPDGGTLSVDFSFDSGPIGQNSGVALVFGDCNLNACLENHLALNNPMVLPNLAPGTYYIVVETDDALDYELDISCVVDCNATTANLSGTVDADQTIRVAQTIYSIAQIVNNVDVEYFAGNSITLDDEFSVEMGCTFLAEIKDCSSALTENEVSPETVILPDAPTTDLAFTIFPNPATNKFQIQVELDKISTVKISITDIVGRTIWQEQKSLETSQHRLDLNSQDWERGIYFVHLEINEQSYVRKLILN